MSTTEFLYERMGLTDVNIFKWIIKDFLKKTENYKQETAFIESAPISIGLTSHYDVVLQLKRISNLEIYFYVDLKKLCASKSMLSVSYSLLDKLNTKTFTLSISKGPSEILKDNYAVGILNNLYNYVVEGDLILLCEIELKNYSSLENPHLAFPRFCESLFFSKELSDVTLEVEDKKIPAHKAILATKSSVLKRMVSTEIRSVKIVDVKYNILKEVLRFIYTGMVTNLDKLAIDIVKAAKLYELNELVMICEKALSKNIGFKNAFEMLKLAESQGLWTLETNCSAFIQLHFKTFQHTEELRELSETNTNLLLELVNNLRISK